MTEPRITVCLDEHPRSGIMRPCNSPKSICLGSLAFRPCRAFLRGTVAGRAETYPPATMQRPIEQRLWPRLKIVDTGCWEWLGPRDQDGYGCLDFRRGFSGREQRAHRIAWILNFGEIPEGKWILHRCDNPPCCNPLHLFIGDCVSNVKDKIAKGRDRYAHGEQAPNAFLKTEQVLEIRRLYAENIKQREIARRFNVNFKLVHKIVHRLRWKHV